MKYKVTNKTFAPLQLSGINTPAKGSVIINSISDGLRIMEKENKIIIKEIKEK